METNRVLLSKVPAGSTVTVAFINSGRGLRRRLASLGILPGAKIRVLSSLGSGQIVLEVFNTKTLLGRGATDKIYVNP